ncbi:peptidase C13 [Dyella psychrodurans]|uniref:Peptidase C13 n=1 Tax=Dyella psychrodurans TaxID=1927960 RepID=A0A370X433_9GAMM|nr:peptidase C13 [Dyella psychrodurans]RDS83184.1 peptidase C13 [Dyella psychrodurans]
MFSVLAFAFLAGAPQAAAVADTFTEREHRAHMAEGAASGPGYQKQFWDKTGNAMTDAYRGCIASNAGDKTPFTLVADISPDGHPLNVEVRAPIPVARCVAAQFSTWTFPAPPKFPGSANYPIVIDMSAK